MRSSSGKQQINAKQKLQVDNINRNAGNAIQQENTSKATTFIDNNIYLGLIVGSTSKAPFLGLIFYASTSCGRT